MSSATTRILGRVRVSPGSRPSRARVARDEPGIERSGSPPVVWLRSLLEGTPGQMRGLAVLGVTAALLFALAAGQAFRSADGALHRAGDNTDQLVRIQAIQTNLVKADADATSLFLVGGLEPPAQRASYTRALESATQLIAEAAQHQPADGPALGAVNQAVVAYAGEIERARADNRLALPVGAQYLREASADLRADALPVLKNLVDANNKRVAGELDNAGLAALWLVVTGLLALAVLAVELVWLARRTRRYLSLPLVAATLLVLVTLVVGSLGLASVASTVNAVRTGVYAATLSTAKARIAAFDAKSNESLTLIAQGSGSAFENAWQASDVEVRTALRQLAGNPAAANRRPLPWPGYVAVHHEIRTLDLGGRWDDAVTKATGSGPQSGNGSFATFDVQSDRQLTDLGAEAASRLDQAGGRLPLGGALGVLAGLLAAVCAWWAFALRLREYR